ncbi:YbaB/EbfC family nucleoid-associated protein [Planctomicrobium sp. SH527]|uniref:YbaB/EbfC family nucleoid-associated protein n=1 Tax=Planctomicrobium sp. SH527 TaxID=3448123 RepID=UPI003F5C8773
MKNLPLLQAKAQEMKSRLTDMRIEATSDCRLVTVVVSGELKVVSLSVSPHLATETLRMEILVRETTNVALVQAREAAAKEVAALAEGLGVPGLPQVMSKFGVGIN